MSPVSPAIRRLSPQYEPGLRVQRRAMGTGKTHKKVKRKKITPSKVILLVSPLLSTIQSSEPIDCGLCDGQLEFIKNHGWLCYVVSVFGLEMT